MLLRIVWEYLAGTETEGNKWGGELEQMCGADTFLIEDSTSSKKLKPEMHQREDKEGKKRKRACKKCSLKSVFMTLYRVWPVDMCVQMKEFVKVMVKVMDERSSGSPTAFMHGIQECTASCARCALQLTRVVDFECEKTFWKPGDPECCYKSDAELLYPLGNTLCGDPLDFCEHHMFLFVQSINAAFKLCALCKKKAIGIHKERMIEVDAKKNKQWDPDYETFARSFNALLEEGSLAESGKEVREDSELWSKFISLQKSLRAIDYVNPNNAGRFVKRREVSFLFLLFCVSCYLYPCRRRLRRDSSRLAKEKNKR